MHWVGNLTAKYNRHAVLTGCEPGCRNREFVVVTAGKISWFAVERDGFDDEIFGMDADGHAARYGFTMHSDRAVKRPFLPVKSERKIVMVWYKLVSKSRNSLHVSIIY